jgi:iron complex outermembrane receptor protein
MMKKSSIRSALLAGAGFAALVTGVAPVAAQEQQAQRGVGIEEIVVTARKREEKLQDVPLSISAFTETELQRRNIEGLNDVARFTPSLSFEDFNGTNESPVIRGQTQTRINNPVQNVATFMDGIYLQRAYMTDVGLLEMERVEVVKGPQSALYGRDSFAGAINYITKKPNFEKFEGNASITVGTDERFDAKAGVGGPIIADKLAFRIGGGISKSDGGWKNNHPLAYTADIDGGSNENLNGWDNKAFNITISAKPVEGLTIEAAWYHADLFQEARASYTLAGLRSVALGLTRNPGTLNCSPTTLAPGVAFGAPAVALTANTLWCGALPATPNLGNGLPTVPTIDPRSFAQNGPVDIIRTQIRYEVTDEIAVQYQFGRALSDVNSAGQSSDDALRGVVTFFGLPFGLLPAGAISFDSQPNGGYEMTSHEFRGEYSSESLQLLGGVYYARSRDTYRAYAYQLSPLGTTPINQLAVGPTAILNQRASTTGGTTNKDEILGIFGSATYQITDALRAGFEGRWTQEDKRLLDRASAASANPNVRRFALLSERFRYFTPRFTVDYKLTSENLVYATVAKGLKTGGFNGAQDRISDEGQRLFDPETNWTYEIGTKNTFFDGRLQANLSAYYIDWKNMQLNEAVRNPVPNVPLTVPAVILGNVGGAKTWGVELEGLFQATDNLSFNYGLSWNNPKYKDGVRLLEFVQQNATPTATFPFCAPNVCSVTGDVSGNTLPRTPKWKGVLGAQWQGEITDTLGYYLRGDVTYQSKAFLEGMNVGWVPSRTLVNASIGVTGEGWDIQLWARNLFDKKYAANSLFLGFANSYVVTLGDRRELGITGTVKF